MKVCVRVVTRKGKVPAHSERGQSSDLSTGSQEQEPAIFDLEEQVKHATHQHWQENGNQNDHSFSSALCTQSSDVP